MGINWLINELIKIVKNNPEKFLKEFVLSSFFEIDHNI